MPESPSPKLTLHPWQSPATGPRVARGGGRGSAAYAELSTTSNFTFLTGASHPEELVRRAAELGHRAASITDRNTLAGIVRAHVAARDVGIPLAVGCHLELEDDGLLLDVRVFPTDRASYGRLCRLLSLGKRRAPKGECDLVLDDLFAHEAGLLAVLAVREPSDEHAELVRRLAHVFDDGRLSLSVERRYGTDDRGHIRRVHAFAQELAIPLLATNDVHYHVRERRELQDVLTCIRHGCTLDAAGFRLFPHAERHLKPAADMAQLFEQVPGALARAVEVAERASRFGLEELRYHYPHELSEHEQRTPMQALVELTRAGAATRYPRGVPDKLERLLEHEFRLIDELEYAPYFLTVADLVTFARSRHILCQGRGAAANSAVCYCLGVTAVDPDRIDLLFERFVSKERDEPPDIDIDFEHERREEVLQYVYDKYGRDRAALTAEVITYRGRSAVREVGKALGLSLDCVDRIAKDIDWWHDTAACAERLRELDLDPNEPTMKRVVRLTAEVLGFPRHLSQHVGGFVITHDPLCELVPIENAAMPDRTVIEWDKDDLDAMGILKIDLLGLGMLTCVRKAFDLVNDFEGANVKVQPFPGVDMVEVSRPESFALHTIPPEDPAVYDMICAADTVGVFQIESRAQMSMLPRLRPREFYDLVIEVAIVRPGPIQGDMVHPYLRRRNGEEPITYPNEEIRRVLGKTLGVPLFQEQAMSLAMVAGGFTPNEADRLRRAMASWKRKGDELEKLGRKLLHGMIANGYSRDFAERFMKQIKGFSEYGFPESHAASFALLVYVSAWLKHHRPAAFAAALINSQPMGFYAPAQIVADARQHGVEVREIDVNHSRWDCTLERTSGLHPAIRLGLRLIKGLRQVHGLALSDAVLDAGPFRDVETLRRASGVRVAALRKLAYADAFRSLGLDRQSALWQVRALRDEPAHTLPFPEPASSPSLDRLPGVSPLAAVMHDYSSKSLSLKAHPVSFLRERLDAMGAVPAAALRDPTLTPAGSRAATAGVVLVRQRPATASGVIFFTLEDESGVSNLIVRPQIFDRFRRAARHSRVLLARGKVERAGEVVHLLTDGFESLDGMLADLDAHSRDFH